MIAINRKKTTILLSIIMAICLTLSAIGFIDSAIKAKANTVETGGLFTTHMSVEKNEFNVGEPILVKATANTKNGTDWIGIRKAGETGYIRWRYIDHVASDVEYTGLGNGAIVDLKVAKFKTGQEAYKDIPAGDYEIVFYKDNGEVVSEIIPITVVNTAYSGTYLKLNQRDFYEGEVSIAHNVTNPGDNDWLAIGKVGYSGSIKYEYLTTSQGRQNIAKGTFINANDMVHYKHDEFKYLQAGDYQVHYVANGSTVETVNITIHAKHNVVTSTSHLKVEKTSFYEGEPILVTPTEKNSAGKDWLGITRSFTNKEYIRWRYVSYASGNTTTAGKGSGTQIDIRQASTPNTSNPLNSLPAGFYQIYFVLNDADIEYASEWINIQVFSAENNAPTSATLNLDDATSGLINGSITVTFENYDNMNSYAKPTDIIMYWADETGVALKEYAPLAKRKISAKTTTFDTYDGVKIPENAKKLLIYGINSSGILSKVPYVITLPNGCQFKNDDELLMEFQIVSDIHVADTQKYGTINLPIMLKDIALYSPNSKGIMVVGDMTDSAKESQYQSLVNVYKSYKNTYPNLPEMFLTLGNHDMMNFGTNTNGDYYDHSSSAYANRVSTYKKYATQIATIDYAKSDKAYYDKWINGVHYVFLATDSIPEDGGKSYISNEQLNWLDKTLAEDRSGKPIFVFVHQALVDTVCGSITTPGRMDTHAYSGVLSGDDYAKYNNTSYGDYSTRVLLQEQPIRNILKKYPEVCFFSGHSHWYFDSPNTMVKGGEDLPITMFNTSSVGYLWQDYDKASGEHLDGSQGYYVRMYKDHMEVLGKNFDKGTWVASAQFVVNTHVHDYEDVKTETEHYKECDCGDIIDRETHIFDNNGNCECGYHKHEYTVKNNETHHYQECACGDIINQVEHSFDSDGNCECNYHKHNYVAKYNETHHYEECSCGDIINPAPHNLTDGACDCGYVDPNYQPPTGDGDEDEGGDITPPPSGGDNSGDGGSSEGVPPSGDGDTEGGGNNTPPTGGDDGGEGGSTQQPSTDNNNNNQGTGISCNLAITTTNGLLGLTALVSVMLVAFVIIKISRRKEDEKA